jgi:hypothetical protein
MCGCTGLRGLPAAARRWRTNGPRRFRRRLRGTKPFEPAAVNLDSSSLRLPLRLRDLEHFSSVALKVEPGCRVTRGVTLMKHPPKYLCNTDVSDLGIPPVTRLPLLCPATVSSVGEGSLYPRVHFSFRNPQSTGAGTPGASLYRRRDTLTDQAGNAE